MFLQNYICLSSKFFLSDSVEPTSVRLLLYQFTEIAVIGNGDLHGIKCIDLFSAWLYSSMFDIIDHPLLFKLLQSGFKTLGSWLPCLMATSFSLLGWFQRAVRSLDHFSLFSFHCQVSSSSLLALIFSRPLSIHTVFSLILLH